MNKIIIIMAAAVLFFIFFAFWLARSSAIYAGGLRNDETAKTLCKNICKQKLNESQDLSNGPCLSNDLGIEGGWVCDAAHNPRSQIDNLPENQCSAYGRTARHFVEVDENCNLIRAV